MAHKFGALRKERLEMIRRITYIMAIGCFLFGHYAFAGDSKDELAALSAAEKWLVLVDGEQYADSWKAASALFKNAIQPDQWAQTMRAGRKPLGRVISRKVKTKVYTTALPGAPDGKYVVIQFNTSFANKGVAVETVTPMMEKDGVWRVSGYYIK